jgi:hypothetical protein
MQCGDQGFDPPFCDLKKIGKIFKKSAKLVEFTLQTQKKHLKKILVDLEGTV